MAGDEQGGLFEGERRRDAGIQQVRENEGESDYTLAFEAAHAVMCRVQSLTGFTIENVKDEIAPDMEPHHHNVLGSMMRTLGARAGLDILRYVKSGRPSRHAARVAVWGRKP